MRTTILVLSAVLTFTIAEVHQTECQKIYLGFGSGLEIPTGMVGITVEGAITME
ncbi:MAG: hypothetical protein ACK500_03015 [Flavobacteriales bacterium]|jgi:hypothetical protein